MLTELCQMLSYMELEFKKIYLIFYLFSNTFIRIFYIIKELWTCLNFISSILKSVKQ